MRINLTRPIQAHGEELLVLEFREPNGDDIAKHGLPFSFASDGAFTPLMKAVNGYTADLAGIPPSSVKTIAPADWVTITGAVSSFFQPGGPPAQATP